ncbi:hypothetical protein Cgig2_015344 [Carnegiea gigantea]|uniref:Ubiquitin-like protease family profile domain-containing protein n=1 Tax=Carnegiea gigantea TaxID=171969 RepID=A0A9Q1GND6_9CARY|nr:hypothetical protein Cgig2_015344 [Carnegiea gigantea]
MAGVVTDVGEATMHEISPVKGADENAICQITADIPGDAPQCSEPHVQPSTEVEDVGTRADDAAAMPCGEDDQQPVEEVGESGAMLGPYVGEAAATIDGPGRDGRGDNAATDDPGIESLHHAPLTTADSAVSGEILGETERTSRDADDVGCGDDGGGNSSSIVTRMRRKPRSWKPAAVHGSPFTNPTRLQGARKSKKEMNEGVTGYISTPSAATEMELVTKVRTRFKGVRPNAKQWEEDMPECLLKLVLVSWLRGLIHVFPKGGAGDRSGKYCIGSLAMDLFTEPLHRRQRTYPNLFWMSVFLKHHTRVTLHNKGRISSVVWDNFKATPQPDVRYRIVVVLTFLRSTTYADAGQWEAVTPKCPEQRNGHDCGVFVMAFMDLLSLKVDGFEFDQDCDAHCRDKCLLSFIQGPVAHHL